MITEAYGVVYLNWHDNFYTQNAKWEMKVFHDSAQAYIFSERQGGFMIALKSETTKYKPTWEDQNALYELEEAERKAQTKELTQ